MPNPESTKQTTEITALLSAGVLAPGLRSLLVFDASYDELRRIAEAAARFLEVFNSQPVQTITLQTTLDDDDLWGSYIPRGDRKDLLFWRPGLLTSDDDNDQPRVVLIPNLAQLSVMAARAAIMLVGEQSTSLERHGQHSVLRPRFFWIAGCATTDVGKVSAHLLDRFALRISGKNFFPSSARRVAELRDLLHDLPAAGNEFLASIDDVQERLKAASKFKPQINDDAIARVLEYLNEMNIHSTRRDLALARFAIANAQLDHKEVVEIAHVDQAAAIMGLQRPSMEETKTPEEDDSLEKEESDEQDSTDNHETMFVSSPAISDAPVEQKPIERLVEQIDVEPEPFPITSLPAAPPLSPYPEDQAAIEHEANPLRLPSRTSERSSAASGPVIGTERATALRDLALVRSLFEAAKFQRIRRLNSGLSADQFILLPPDLHSYRREPIAEQMLVMVMDYTSLKGKAWEEALFPYIREAYTERAMICFVKVGAADSPQELRAEKIEARSILVPSVAHAFSIGPGRATPLAHGLDLAYQSLRRHLQHGRGGPYRATLVVLSDGRGNVPLEASRKGQITLPVFRRGFDDALSIAQQIRGLDYVRTVLLNPASDQHQEMPLELASALGAQLKEIENRN